MNGNFLYTSPESSDALRLYLRQLLERDQLESASEIVLQLAEESAEEAQAALDEAGRFGKLEQVLGLISAGDGWMRLARASALRSLRGLASPTPAARPLWSEQPRAQLFGRLRVSYQSRELLPEDWPSSKALRLFACLLARRGNPLSSAAAIDMLWPELCPGRGRSSLRNCLYQVRFALRDLLGIPGEGVLRCRRQDTLTLERRFSTDFEELERALDEAPHNPAVAGPAEALYVGPLLDGLDDPWVGPLRARLADARGRLLHFLADSQLRQGQAQRAEQTARRALEHDDLSEQAWSDLLRSQVNQGRESDAHRSYREAVAHFQAELGFRPAALGEAYDRLLAPAEYLKVS